MKKTRSKEVLKRRVDADEILPEYDFRAAQPNKYAFAVPCWKFGGRSGPRCRRRVPDRRGS